MPHKSVCHRYRPEIPEPAPSLFQHGAPIGGIQDFPTIKITVICQVCMYCGLSAKINMCETPHAMQRSWTYFVLCFFRVCGRQNPNAPIGAPWPTTPLHGGIIGVLRSPFHICGVCTVYLTQVQKPGLFHLQLDTILVPGLSIFWPVVAV